MKDELIYRQDAIEAMWGPYEMIRNGATRRKGNIDGSFGLLLNAIKSVPAAQKELQWIPCSERLPEVDEEGESNYILLSFANATIPCIGQYREDKEGGAFYDGDEEEPLVKIGLIVNAWMPFPEPYREDLT